MLGIHELVGDGAVFPSSPAHEDSGPSTSTLYFAPSFEGARTFTPSNGREREGKGGGSGYSPAGVMDWRAIHAASPRERKRIARKTRVLLPLTNDVIRKHLTGN